MRGNYLAKLMCNSWLKEELAKHARRYSKQVEDQEEYIQDAWLRIAEQQEGKELDYYAEQGRKAIYAIYLRQWRKNNVFIKKKQSENGICATAKEKPPPKRAVKLYRNKYLDTKHTTIDWQYYEGQEEELLQRAKEDIEWYKQYEGFDQLTDHEKNEVIYGFINSGFWVGLPKNGTRGKKMRFYEMYYTVDNTGIVNKTNMPHHNEIESSGPAIGGKYKMDLSEWYKLRKLGGSAEWLEKLDKMIAEHEEYIELNNRGLD